MEKLNLSFAVWGGKHFWGSKILFNNGKAQFLDLSSKTFFLIYFPNRALTSMFAS